MERSGTLYSYTVVRCGTEAFHELAPYVLAVVEEKSKRRMARIDGYTDKTDITIGMEVTFLENDERGNPIYTF